ncbi:MAG TPA: hypothetical protein PLQ93_05695 [Bacteroidia bacterium]|nr:hypothetical protein [Bacteroidia bacterium]
MTLRIQENQTASGKVGLATFEGAKLVKNVGDPVRTGVAYRIECGRIGRIFPSDPVEQKEVEIWLGPIHNNMMAELRLTEGIALFPMAGMEFHKKKAK